MGATADACGVSDIVRGFVPRVAAAVGVLAVFWLGAVLIERLVNRIGLSRGLDADLAHLLARVARLALLTFGAVTALGTVGIDVKALVAGLGLTGFALGFALKDIIANTLSGILILLYRPFHRGDRVDVSGSAGIVEAIDMRYTVLVADDGTRVLVPNATLFTNSIRVRRSGP